jgi:predicted nucleotidyltransferase
VTEFDQLLKGKFSNYPGLIALLIYGSYANGKQTLNSDLDLAYLTDYKNPLSKLELLESFLGINELPMLDLTCLNTCNPIIGMQIIKNHRVIILNSKIDLIKWELKTLSKYHDLQIANREIYKNLGR